MTKRDEENLSIVILTKPNLNWQSFFSWYTIYNNLPKADVRITCEIDSTFTFEFYQWAKKLKIPFSMKKDTSNSESYIKKINLSNVNESFRDNILIVNPYCIFLNEINQSFYTDFSFGDNFVFLKKSLKDTIIEDYYLDKKENSIKKENIPEAKDSNTLTSIVSYEKGCGRWINTSKGCPFSNAAGLVSDDMTVNEMRIIELWKKLTPLYKVVT